MAMWYNTQYYVQAGSSWFWNTRGDVKSISPKLPWCCKTLLWDNHAQDISADSPIIYYQMPVCGKGLVQVSICRTTKKRGEYIPCTGLIQYRRGQVKTPNWYMWTDSQDIIHDEFIELATNELTSLPSKLLPQELNHSLESIGRCNLVEVLLHDWSISDSLEAYNHCSLEHQSLWLALMPWTIPRIVTFRRILLFVCVQRLQSLSDVLSTFLGHRADVNFRATRDQRHAYVWGPTFEYRDTDRSRALKPWNKLLW